MLNNIAKAFTAQLLIRDKQNATEQQINTTL